MVEYVTDLAAALWQAVPFAGHTGTGELQDILVSTKDMVCSLKPPPGITRTGMRLHPERMPSHRRECIHARFARQ